MIIASLRQRMHIPFQRNAHPIVNRLGNARRWLALRPGNSGSGADKCGKEEALNRPAEGEGGHISLKVISWLQNGNRRGKRIDRKSANPRPQKSLSVYTAESTDDDDLGRVLSFLPNEVLRKIVEEFLSPQ